MVLRSYSRWEVNRSVIKLVSTILFLFATTKIHAQYTGPNGISGNNIVGQYESAAGGTGFLYNGSFTTFTLPGPGVPVVRSLNGISGNNIVGAYEPRRHRVSYTASFTTAPATQLWRSPVCQLLSPMASRATTSWGMVITATEAPIVPEPAPLVFSTTAAPLQL